MECKHPEIKVTLIGEDGNAYAILGKVIQALKRAGYKEDAAAFREQATSGDYGKFLRTCMEYVEVE